jgi:RHS repeat-associated protein
VNEEYIGKTTEYIYDKLGNRNYVTIKENGIIKEEHTYNYNYDLNQLNSVIVKVDGTVASITYYTYDANGNQIKTETDGITTIFAYDEFNQLISADGAKYGYNAEGYRVSKNVNGSLTRYIYEYDKVVLEVNAAGNQVGRNIYGINLLMRTVDSESYYYMYNGHADVTALINAATCNIDATYYYDAFGNITESTGAAKDKNSILYSGYQYDSETGLYYLNARMYDPKIARFLQEDTYTGNPNDPLSLNLYTYVKNNPLIYYDPTGHNGEKLRDKFYSWIMGSPAKKNTDNTGGWDNNASPEEMERWDRVISVADDSQKYRAEYSKVKIENSAEVRAEAVMSVKESASVVAGFTPIDGIKDAADFITGKDVITGKKINRVILGIMIFTPEVIDKGLRGFAKSGKNVAEETLEAGIKNSIQESSEATIKRGVKNGVQESSEVAIKRGIKKSDELVEASTGLRFADNIDDYGKVNIPELPKNAVQKNYLEVTRTGNNVSSGVGNKQISAKKSIANKVKELKKQGFQEHHIISDKNPLTKEHELFDLAGYNNPNDFLQLQKNKIYLPKDASLHPTRSIHKGRHYQSVSQNLSQLMDDVVDVGKTQGWTTEQFNEALTNIVKNERQLLKDGTRILNKNRR